MNFSREDYIKDSIMLIYGKIGPEWMDDSVYIQMRTNMGFRTNVIDKSIPYLDNIGSKTHIWPYMTPNCNNYYED